MSLWEALSLTWWNFLPFDNWTLVLDSLIQREVEYELHVKLLLLLHKDLVSMTCWNRGGYRVYRASKHVPEKDVKYLTMNMRLPQLSQYSDMVFSKGNFSFQPEWETWDWSYPCTVSRSEVKHPEEWWVSEMFPAHILMEKYIQVVNS